jgi:chromosomal replication initiation ATPase DnaA
VARNTKEEFRSFYQACAGLLIDNMEYIEGDDQALTEVCRTIEALRDRGALVVVAMRSGDIVADFEKAIKWRELGHVQKRSIAPLKPLDQKKIVKSRIVGLLGVLEPQHIERVCSAVGSRIDDLDDALRTLLRKRSSEDKRKPIHHSELIAQLTLTPTFIGPFALVKFVSKELKVPEEVIRGDSRSPDALRGREFAALLADKLNKSARWLRPAIGKDHSTVARSLARAKARYEKDSTFRLEFDRIEARYVSMRTPTGRVASLPT